MFFAETYLFVKKNNAHLTSNGFRTEASDGYMIFPSGGELLPPYFRKGVLGAEKKRRIVCQPYQIPNSNAAK